MVWIRDSKTESTNERPVPLVFTEYFFFQICTSMLLLLLPRTAVVNMNLDLVQRRKMFENDIRSIYNQFNYGRSNFNYRKSFHIKLRKRIVFRDMISILNF